MGDCFKANMTKFFPFLVLPSRLRKEVFFFIEIMVTKRAGKTRIIILGNYS